MEWATRTMWSRKSGRAEKPDNDRVVADALNSLHCGVLVLDPTDRPVLANPAAVALGLLRDPDDQPPQTHHVHTVIRTLAGQVRRSGVRREVELDLPRTIAGTGPPGPGQLLGVRVKVGPLGGTGYEPGHVAVEASDVTEAHRVARVRRDFVANVSHELKTPVGALALLAETLLDAADDPQASRRFAERIHKESQRLARLVQELLELSRLQGAEPLPAPVPVSADRIIAEVIDRTRTAASAKNINVGVRGARGVTVYGDENQLATAVANLVENAIAYSPDESTVTVGVDIVDDVVEVTVIDHGIGIASHDLDRIFERFYRADQARSRVTGGTGLGLAIVKHIAVNHGGQVDVESTLAEGSTFTLRLPARRPDAALPLPAGIEIDWVGSDSG